METLWGQIFRIFSTLSSCKSCRSTGSICTHQAHHTYMLKIVFFDIFCAWCVPICAYNVPDVCTYFIKRTTSKSNVSAFRERVQIVYTTKTRLYNCIYFFAPFLPQGGNFQKKRNASFKGCLFFSPKPVPNCNSWERSYTALCASDSYGILFFSEA